MNWNAALHAPDTGTGAGTQSGGEATGGAAGPSAGVAGGNGLDPAGHGLSQGSRPGQGSGGGAGVVADPSKAPPGATQWTVPDFIPAHLRDDDPTKFAAKLADDWKRQRDDIGKRGAAPKEPAGYAFKPSDKAAPFVGGLEADPVFLAFRAEAHKAGMAPEAFQTLLGGFYDTLVDKGVLGAPYDAGKERRGFLGDAAKTMSDDQTVEAMRPHIAQAETFLQGLQRNNTLKGESVKALEPLLETAVGLRTLAALRHALANRGLAFGGEAGAGAGGITRAELQTRMRDPRNDRNSGKYDAKFASEIDADYKKLFGAGT